MISTVVGLFLEEEVLLHRHFRALEQEMEVHNSEYKGPLQSERFVHVAIPSEPIWIRNKSRDFAIEQCDGFAIRLWGYKEQIIG